MITRRTAVVAAVVIPATSLATPAGVVTREPQYGIDAPIDGMFVKLDGKLHSIDGEPSVVIWDRDTGMVMLRAWHQHCQQHRTDGPASILYSDDDKPFEQWYARGRLLRDSTTPKRPPLPKYDWANPPSV